MSDRKMVKDETNFSRWDFECDLADLSAKVEEWIDSYGAEASLDCDLEYGYYDEISIEFTLKYEREENDREYKARLKRETKAAEKKTDAKEKKRLATNEKSRATRLRNKIIKEMKADPDYEKYLEIKEKYVDVIE